MLVTRIITAIVMVLPLIILLVFAPQPIPLATGLVLYTLASWEWSKLVPGVTSAGRFMITAAYFVLMLLVVLAIAKANAPGGEAYFGALGFILLLAMAWWLIATVFVWKFPFSPPPWLIVVSGALIIVPAFSVLAQVNSVEWWQPAKLLALTFLLVWAADIGAYFTGRAFGRRKLAPSVSPGKTWEGLVGGLVLALVVAAIYGLSFNHQLTQLLPLAAIVVLASVIGDLTVSLFKRNAAIKDMGAVFPGHGGVMDRFDSFSAAAPVLFGLLAVFSAIPAG
ncbi:MAG: phosphatidate cytidylyltransferase [Gammaproteobacteria bacterium]